MLGEKNRKKKIETETIAFQFLVSLILFLQKLHIEIVGLLN